MTYDVPRKMFHKMLSFLLKNATCDLLETVRGGFSQNFGFSVSC
jgi:hypothetical protein